MIVREQDDHLYLIGQHDHALLSGWLATAWGGRAVSPPPAPAAGLLLASAMHDVGWLELDASPTWHKQAGLPYSFLDEQLERKLPAYRSGLDWVAAADPFAGLLCSLHYSSFFPAGKDPGLQAEARSFVEAERTRQARLRRALRRQGRDLELDREAFCLQLLKLWDDLSLYVALNEPGSAKEAEHPWYRDGFRETWITPETYPKQEHAVRFRARWLDAQFIALTPFPFRAELPYALPFRRLSRTAVQEEGFESAYEGSQVQHLLVRFVPDPQQ